MNILFNKKVERTKLEKFRIAQPMNFLKINNVKDD